VFYINYVILPMCFWYSGVWKNTISFLIQYIYRHDITQILLKVALNTAMTLTLIQYIKTSILTTRFWKINNKTNIDRNTKIINHLFTGEDNNIYKYWQENYQHRLLFHSNVDIYSLIHWHDGAWALLCILLTIKNGTHPYNIIYKYKMLYWHDPSTKM
jgi:hypothetical protein